jgi:hypothetical protein
MNKSVLAITENIISSPQLNSKKHISLSDTKAFTRVLNEKLKQLTLDLVDPEAWVDLGWIKFSPEEKATNYSGLYYAVSVYTTEIETASKLTTNLRIKLRSLEENVEKMLGGV